MYGYYNTTGEGILLGLGLGDTAYGIEFGAGGS